MAKPLFLQALIANPKRLFVWDAIGALLTSLFLFGFLAPFQEYFGMPRNIVQLLAGIAFCFFLYSIACHLLLASNWKPYLGFIMVCNAVYVLFSIGLIYSHFDQLTSLGLTYFLLEIAVIAAVVLVEYTSFRQLASRGLEN